MAGPEVREDIVQPHAAARDAAPDASPMRGLEAVVDGGGSLLGAAAVLISGERWDAQCPDAQTPAEFAGAGLDALSPGADPARWCSPGPRWPTISGTG